MVFSLKDIFKYVTSGQETTVFRIRPRAALQLNLEMIDGVVYQKICGQVPPRAKREVLKLNFLYEVNRKV